MLTNNLLGIPLIYCICGDTDDGSTSKFGGTNGIHVDTLMNYVISDDDIDGKSKATNGSQCSEQYHKKKKKRYTQKRIYCIILLNKVLTLIRQRHFMLKERYLEMYHQFYQFVRLLH